MSTQAEIERLARQLLTESDSGLTLSSAEPLDNNQDELWNIDVKCLGCEVGGFSILTQEGAGDVADQIRLKIQQHLAAH